MPPEKEAVARKANMRKILKVNTYAIYRRRSGKGRRLWPHDGSNGSNDGAVKDIR